MAGWWCARLAANYYQEHSADYYMEDVDHQGQWMGSGAQELGLEGAVDRSEFQLGLPVMWQVNKYKMRAKKTGRWAGI